MNFDVPYVGTEPPKVERIHLVIPLSRPEMLSRVRDNVLRQRFKPASVVIVENGRAVGACKEQGFESATVLTSEAHQSYARNEALAHLRKHHPDDYWVAMDDDDQYGGEYLAEHAGLARRSQCVGKSTHWVIFEGCGTVVLRPWASSGSARSCNGGTIGAYISDSPDFVVREIGEDTIFSNVFVARGGKVWVSSPYHVAYCRRGDGRDEHTYKCVHRDFLKTMGNRYMAFEKERLDLAFAERYEVGEILTAPTMPRWLGG